MGLPLCLEVQVIILRAAVFEADRFDYALAALDQIRTLIVETPAIARDLDQVTEHIAALDAALSAERDTAVQPLLRETRRSLEALEAKLAEARPSPTAQRLGVDWPAMGIA